MYLFFDTETVGLPERWDVPITDMDNWPRLVQLAWIVCDVRGEVLEERNAIIKPEGFSIPAEISKLHGITTSIANEHGEPLKEVLELFAERVDKAWLLVGHNISFDECVVGAEFERLRMMTSLFLKPKYCTMKGSINYCKLPGNNGFKSPKLVELYQILFGSRFDNAHDALADVKATMKCFWKLKELRLA